MVDCQPTQSAVSCFRFVSICKVFTFCQLFSNLAGIFCILHEERKPKLAMLLLFWTVGEDPAVLSLIPGLFASTLMLCSLGAYVG